MWVLVLAVLITLGVLVSFFCYYYPQQYYKSITVSIISNSLSFGVSRINYSASISASIINNIVSISVSIISSIV